MKENQASSTAILIAKAHVFMLRDAVVGQFIPKLAEDYSNSFLEDCGISGYREKSAKPIYRAMLRLVEKITVPGILTHYIARKAFIENAVRKAIGGGAGQVVVLAAGFDTLALRLHEEFPDVEFFELDHPATQSIKKGTISRLGKNGKNLQLIPIDFSKNSTSEVLKKAGRFSEAKKTVFVAEGITMYLNDNEIDNMFKDVSGLSCKDSLLIFTFMEKNSSGGDIFAKLTDLWLKMKKEPYKWAIANRDLGKFLDKYGYKLESFTLYQDIQKEMTSEKKRIALSKIRAESICVSIKY